VRDERHRGLLVRLGDPRDALRPWPPVPRPAVRHAGRVPGHAGRVPGVPGRRNHLGRAVPPLRGHRPDHWRGGALAMAFGRPRQPNDPSVMSSVETALSSVPRPGLLARLWHWRYELALLAGLLAGSISIGVILGPGWLIATAAAAAATGACALAWPDSRRRLAARAWCVITPHRVRTGCTHAWIQTRDGRLPA